MVTAGEFLLKGNIRQKEINEIKKIIGFDAIHKVRGNLIPRFDEIVYLIFQNFNFYKVQHESMLYNSIAPIIALITRIDTYISNEGKIMKNVILDIGLDFNNKKFTMRFSGEFFKINSMIRNVEKRLSELVLNLNQGDCLLVEYINEVDVKVSPVDQITGKRKLK